MFKACSGYMRVKIIFVCLHHLNRRSFVVFTRKHLVLSLHLLLPFGLIEDYVVNNFDILGHWRHNASVTVLFGMSIREICPWSYHGFFFTLYECYLLTV